MINMGKNNQDGARTREPSGSVPSLAELVRACKRVATRNPWLVKEGKQRQDFNESEEAKLRQCNKIASKLGSLKPIDNLLSLWTMRRAASTTQQPAPSGHTLIRNRLELDFSFGQFAATGSGAGDNRDCQLTILNKPRNVFLRKLMCCSMLAILAHSSLKVGKNLILLYQHDKVITCMQPRVSAGASVFDLNTRTQLYVVGGGGGGGAGHHSGDNPIIDADTLTREGNNRVQVVCARQEDITYADPELTLGQLRELSARLESSGAKPRSQIGSLYLGESFILAAPYFYYCLPTWLVFLRRDGLRFDVIAFLYEPIRERRRLLAELRVVLMNLVSEFAHTHTGGGGKSSLEARYMLRTLNTIHQGELVRPVVVSSHWYCQLASLAKRIPITGALFASIAPSSMLVLLWGLDIVARVGERKALTACAHWHPNATLLRPNIYLDPARLYLSHEEQRVYESYRESPVHYYSAMLSMMKMVAYEMRHSLTWPAVVLALRLALLCAFIGLWSAICSGLFFLALLNVLTWLSQIREQILCCHRQVMENLHRRNPSRGVLTEQEQELLVTRMTIAYLNYELFKRQYRYYRRYSDIFIAMCFAFAASCYTTFYLVTLNAIKSNSSTLVFCGMFGLILCMNALFITCSLAPTYIESVVREVVRLLALTANYPQLASKPMRDLWRRQLLTDKEVSLFTSTRVLTYQISHGRVVEFNVQLVAIQLLLWQTLLK